jgi:succinate dehydrogenase/fumarate reductase flavoprotein subunit
MPFAAPRGTWVATTAPALLHMVAAWRLQKGRRADGATLNRRYGGHARSWLTAFSLDNVTNIEELTS